MLARNHGKIHSQNRYLLIEALDLYTERRGCFASDRLCSFVSQTSLLSSAKPPTVAIYNLYQFHLLLSYFLYIFSTQKKYYFTIFIFISIFVFLFFFFFLYMYLLAVVRVVCLLPSPYICVLYIINYMYKYNELNLFIIIILQILI